MKKNKGLVIAAIVILIVAMLMFIAYKALMPKAQMGEKNITVTVIHADKSEKEFNYDTDFEYLGEVITEEGLVEGSMGSYGMFITTADGETVDDSKQQWWCITKGGEMVNTSADQTPLADGDRYEITMMEGY